MTEQPDKIELIFEDMVKTGLLSTSNQWIEKATKQRNPRLTMELAYSKIMEYDTAEKMLFSISDLN
jgi:hypothetical protein